MSISMDGDIPLTDSADHGQPSAAAASGGPLYELYDTLPGHAEPTTSLSFASESHLLASGASDKTVRVWKQTEGTRGSSSRSIRWNSATLKGHGLGVSDVAWCPDDVRLASASDDQTVRIWDSSTEQCIQVLEGHTSYVFTVDFCPGDPNLVVSGGYDHSIRLWDLRQKYCAQTIPAHAGPVACVHCSYDGLAVASGGFDAVCRIWDIATGSCRYTFFDDESVSRVSYLRFAPNNTNLLVSTLDNKKSLWDYENGTCVRTYGGHINSEHCCAAVFSAPDAEYVIGGSEDGRVCIWDSYNENMAQEITHFTEPIVGLTVHPVDSLLAFSALSTENKTITIWKPRS